MMILKACFFILVLFFISSESHAGGSSGYGTVSSIYVNGGWTMVTVPALKDSAINNPDDCPSNEYYALDPNQVNYSVLHSTLLAAFMAGKQVRLYLLGCGGQNKNHPQIVSVWIYQ